MSDEFATYLEKWTIISHNVLISTLICPKGYKDIEIFGNIKNV